MIARIAFVALALSLAAAPLHAQPAPGDAMAMARSGGARPALARKLAPAELVALLRQGGYVILMRHANSPGTLPDAASADPENTGHERQLDSAGLADAAAFGAGLRRARVRIGAVFTSPAFRARETLRAAGIAPFATRDFLDIRIKPGQPMPQADIDATRQLLQQPPAPGTNTLVITHFPNVAAQFPDEGRTLGEGDMLILDPAHGALRVVGALAIGDWANPAITD